MRGEGRSPIRILFAGSTFVLGGAERVAAHLVTGLNRSPFQVDLLALRQPGRVAEELRDQGIALHFGLTGSGRVDPLLLPRLHHLLRRGRYDVLYMLDHAHTVAYSVAASTGTRIRVRLMPVHTMRQADGSPSLARPIQLVRSRLDRIIAIAEAQKRYLSSEEGVPAEQIAVIPNGIPVLAPGLEERARSRAEVRREFGVSVDAPVVSMTAVLRPEKNHELCLRAFARARERYPGAELWVVGDGPRGPSLREEASRLGLPWVEVTDDGATGPSMARPREFEADGVPSVRFFGRRSDARRIMAGADIAVLSSHPLVETLPLSLLEAMDAGLAVVATDVGALAEMVADGSSGLLVPPGDEAAFAGALTRLLGDEEELLGMGRRGQEIVRERYSVERMVEATADLILRVLRDKSRSGQRE